MFGEFTAALDEWHFLR